MASNPVPQILLTRPAPQSQAFAEELRAAFGAHLRIDIAPLFEIAPLAATLNLTSVEGVVFTSMNAVAAFGAQTSRRDCACYCVGARTAAAARKIGFQPLDAGGDADDLLALVAALPKAKLLYPRGRHVAQDIAAKLRVAGHEVREVVVYEQRTLPLSSAAVNLLRSAEPLLLPLFSPRSAGLFMQALPQGAKAPMTALCLSRNVAQALQPERFQAVRIAAEPTAASLSREIAAWL